MPCRELQLELSKMTSSECMAPRARLELATLGLEIPCSIQLSYRGNLFLQLVLLFFRAAVPGWLTPATIAVGPMFGFTGPPPGSATWQTFVADIGAACDQSNESRKFNKVRRAERLTRLAR